MKHPNRLLVVVVILATTLLSYVLPAFVHKATITKDEYPFVYYSSRLREIMLIDYTDKVHPMTDLRGKQYTTAEFDSLMPLLNFRQLMTDNRLPDSLDGYEISPRTLRTNSIVYRYDPRDMATPKLDMYAMLETMPVRGGLTAPSDFFRIKDRIEFIDAATNEVNQAKSELFAKEMLKRGYEFPTQWAAGDSNVRKSYDEGYFCLDNRGELYHIKMVNGRPSVRNTGAADSINIAYFTPMTVATKRFYGFMASREGEFYILESDNEGGYAPVKLDIEPIDLARDRVMVMGNLFYWNIAITTPEGRNYRTLRADDLSQIASHHISRESNLWDKLSVWMFPTRLGFESGSSNYIYARVYMGVWGAWVISLVLALIYIFALCREDKILIKVFKGAAITIGGVSGLIAILILPRFKK